MANHWTEAESALLVKLRAEGASFTQVSRELPGKSRSAVIGRANRMGMLGQMPKRPKQPRGRPPTRPVGTHLPGHNRVRRPPVKSKPLPPPVQPDGCQGLVESLLDLRPGQCHWPHGDGPFTFCGQPIERVGSDHPYCAWHNKASYRARGIYD